MEVTSVCVILAIFWIPITAHAMVREAFKCHEENYSSPHQTSMNATLTMVAVLKCARTLMEVTSACVNLVIFWMLITAHAMVREVLECHDENYSSPHQISMNATLTMVAVLRCARTLMEVSSAHVKVVIF